MVEPMEVLPSSEAELQPEASPEVKSKHSVKRKVLATPERETQQQPLPHPDKNFDRQPVFLVMASGQIQSAEVML